MAKFKNLSLLGMGGFGEVFICERDTDGERFALKRLLPTADKDAIARFQRECRLQSALDHPNIVKVIAKRLNDPPYYYVMPLYLNSLASILPSIVADQPRIQQIFGAILDAIEFAHQEGVIHRDLKPANVLMNGFTDVVVGDFGLGRKLDSDSTRQTTTGFGMGTALYMAPEQWANAKDADERSDVYALGRILYEMYTGPLTSMAQDASQLPGGIDLIVNRCTHADPKKRFQTVTILKQAFSTLAGEMQGEGELQEFMKLQAKLSVPGNHQGGDLDRFLHLLLKLKNSEEDFAHTAIMAIAADSIGQLFENDKDATKALLLDFCADAAARGWPFSYTDKIATHCERIFGVVDDPEIRAALVSCLGAIGHDHNRWFVIGVAAKLLQGKKTPAERLALVDALGNLEAAARSRLGEYTKATALDPALLPLLKPDA